MKQIILSLIFTASLFAQVDSTGLVYKASPEADTDSLLTLFDTDNPPLTIIDRRAVSPNEQDTIGYRPASAGTYYLAFIAKDDSGNVSDTSNILTKVVGETASGITDSLALHWTYLDLDDGVVTGSAWEDRITQQTFPNSNGTWTKSSTGVETVASGYLRNTSSAFTIDSLLTFEVVAYVGYDTAETSWGIINVGTVAGAKGISLGTAADGYLSVVATSWGNTYQFSILNNFYHLWNQYADIIVTWDGGSTLAVYINGVAQSDVANVGCTPETSAIIYTYCGGYLEVAGLKIIKVWDKFFTAEEASTQYNSSETQAAL